MIPVKISADPHTGELPPGVPEDYYDEAIAAGWTDDPRDGKSFLLEDGREVPNPLPVAPPVGYVYEPTIMDRLSQMLDKRLAALLEAQALEETEAEANDFDIDEDEEIRSIYEISLQDEFPEIPRSISAGDPVSTVSEAVKPPKVGSEGVGEPA